MNLRIALIFSYLDLLELEKKLLLTPDVVLFMFKPRKVGSVTHKCGVGLGLSGLAW